MNRPCADAFQLVQAQAMHRQAVQKNLFDLDGHYSGVVHATVEADESAHFPEYVAEHVVGLHISTVVHRGDDALETEVLTLEVLRIG